MFFGEFVLLKGMGVGFKKKMMLHCYRKGKYQQLQGFDNRYIIF